MPDPPPLWLCLLYSGVLMLHSILLRLQILHLSGSVYSTLGSSTSLALSTLLWGTHAPLHPPETPDPPPLWLCLLYSGVLTLHSILLRLQIHHLSGSVYSTLGSTTSLALSTLLWGTHAPLHPPETPDPPPLCLYLLYSGVLTLHSILLSLKILHLSGSVYSTLSSTTSLALSTLLWGTHAPLHPPETPDPPPLWLCLLYSGVLTLHSILLRLQFHHTGSVYSTLGYSRSTPSS
ncbi:unnamed protein product [Leuciscus chuanchicus]